MKGKTNDFTQVLNEIKSKSSLSEIISNYISLEKKGANHMAVCPFHQDTTPSLSISDSKGIYKCFVCGESGNSSATFVSKFNGISFAEGVKEVAEKVGVEWKGHFKIQQEKLDPIQKRGFEINEEANIFFKYNLKNNLGDKIKEYIDSRGLDEAMIERFDIGFSGNNLSDFLANKGFTEDEIIQFGFAKRKEDGGLYDYFIDRLMFPIRDHKSRIVGFSGRVVEESKYAKYLNSPETPVFKKDSVLFNFNEAKKNAHLKKEIIIVEGFMDVIALNKVGIENVVSTMGVSLTKKHSKLIRESTKRVLLAFDGDIAGINATIKTGKDLLIEGFEVNVVSMKGGKDFDDVVKQGQEKVYEILNNNLKFVNFYKKMIFKMLDQQGENVSFELFKELLKILAIYSKQYEPFTANRIIVEASEKYKIERELIDKEYNMYMKGEYRS